MGKSADMPEENARENELDENTDQQKLQETLDELTRIKLDLFKKDFDNELLITRIKFLQREITQYKENSNNEKNKEAQDYTLNYNTKENYVEYLQEKIRFMQDEMGGNNFSERMQEMEGVKQKNIGLQENNKRLRKMYMILKDKNSKLQKDSDNFNQIIEPAKKMRKILDTYYSSAKINNTLMNELKLDEPHPILSEENEDEVENSDDNDMYQNFSKAKLIQLLQEANAKCEEQAEEIQKLIKEKTTIKIEQMKSIDTLKEEFQAEKNQLKITFETEITKVQKKLTIKMKRQKEELNKVIDEKEKVVEASKRNVLGEEGQIQMVKNQLKQAQKQLETQKKSNKKLQEQIDEMKAEQIQQQNDMMRKIEENKKKGLEAQKRLTLQMENLGSDTDQQKQIFEQKVKECEDLQNKFDELQEQHLQTLGKFSENEKKLNELRDKDNKNKDELDSMLLTVSQLNVYKKLAEQNMANSQINIEDIVNAQAERDKLKTQMQIAQTEIKTLEEEKEQQEDQITKLKKELQDSENKQKEQTKQISQLQQDIEMMKGEMEGGNKQQSLAKSTIDQQKDNLEQLQKTFQQKQNKFKNFFKKFDIDIEILDENETEAELLLLNEKFTQQKLNLENNQQQLDFYRKEANKQNEIIQSTLLMQSQINTTDPEILKKELDNRKQDIKRLKNEQRLKNQLLKDQKTELSKLRERVTELEREKTLNIQRISQFEGMKEQLENNKELMRLSIKQGTGFGDQQESMKLQANIDMESREKNFFKEQFEQKSNDLKEVEKERNELANKVQELSVKGMYDKMMQEKQDERIKELQERTKNINNDLEKEKIENENLKDQYKRLQKAMDQEEFNNPEKTVKFKVLLKENTDLKDGLSNYKNQLTMKDNDLQRKERQMNEIQQELKKSEEITLKNKKLREIIRSRDQEVVELIKDANRKKVIFDQMKSMLQNTQFKDQLNQLDIGLRETKIQILETGNKQIEQSHQKELQSFRVRFNVQKTGIEETKLLYKKLEEMDIKLDELKNSEKIQEIKSSPLFIEQQMKLKELENILKMKEEQIINNKYKLESTSDYLNKNTTEKKNLDQKLDLSQQQIQKLEGQLGELRSAKGLLDINIREIKSYNQNQKEEISNLERKLRGEITRNTEYKVVVNDLENKIKRLQERLDQSQAEIFNKNKQIEYSKKENQRLEEELINSAEAFINKASNQEPIQVQSNSQIEDLENRIQNQKKQIKELENQYETSKKDHQTQCKKYENQIQSLNQKVNFYLEKTDLTDEQLLSLEREQGLLQQIEEKNQHIIELEEQLILQKDKKERQNSFNNDQESINESVFSINEEKQKQQYFGTNTRNKMSENHDLCNERMGEQRKQINQLETQNDLLQNQINRYLDLLKDKNQDENVRNSLRQFFTNQNLDNQQSKEESRILEQKRKISEQKNEILELQKDNYYLKDKLKSLELQYEDKSQKYQQVYQDYHKLKEQIKMQEISSGQKKADTDKILQILEEKDKYYQNLLKMNDQEIQKLKTMKNKLEEQKQENQKLLKTIDSLETQLKVEQEKFKVSKQMADTIQDKYDKLQKAHKSESTAKNEIENKNKEWQQKYENEQTNTKKLEEENTVQKNQIQDLQQTIDQRNKSIYDLNIKIEKLDKQLIQESLGDEQLKIKFREKEREIVALKKQIEINQDLELELNGLKRQILENNLKKQENSDDIIELKKKYDEQQTELTDLQNKFNSAKNSIKLKEEKIQQQNDDLKKQQGLIDDLESEKNLLQKEIEKNLEEMKVIDREHSQQEQQFEQEYSDLTSLVNKKISEMKIFKTQTDQKIISLEKENQILTLTNEGLHRKVAQMESTQN